jgi:hypothetical protein
VTPGGAVDPGQRQAAGQSLRQVARVLGIGAHPPPGYPDRAAEQRSSTDGLLSFMLAAYDRR